MVIVTKIGGKIVLVMNLLLLKKNKLLQMKKTNPQEEELPILHMPVEVEKLMNGFGSHFIL